jgi:hypothetical protein
MIGSLGMSPFCRRFMIIHASLLRDVLCCAQPSACPDLIVTSMICAMTAGWSTASPPTPGMWMLSQRTLVDCASSL